MIVCVTGINGFIGRSLAARLKQEGHTVVGLGRAADPVVEGLASYIQGSVLDVNVVEEALIGVDAVFHLASLTDHESIVNRKSEALEVGFNGTLNLLRVFNRSAEAQQFFFASTGKVYGEGGNEPLSESSVRSPRNNLGKLKAMTEDLIEYFIVPQKKYVSFRIFQAYGKEQRAGFVIPTILDQIRAQSEEEALELKMGDISAKRDYIYLEDVIDAFSLVLNSDLDLRNGYEAYNVCSGIEYSVADIVNVLGEILQRKIELFGDSSKKRIDEADTEFGSFKKLNSIFGWEPQTDLRTGLTEVLAS